MQMYLTTLDGITFLAGEKGQPPVNCHCLLLLFHIQELSCLLEIPTWVSINALSVSNVHPQNKIVDTKLNSWRWGCELTFDQYCTCVDWNSYSSTKTCTGIMLTQCDCSRMKLVCQWKWWMQMLWFNLVHGSIFILHPLS